MERKKQNDDEEKDARNVRLYLMCGTISNNQPTDNDRAQSEREAQIARANILTRKLQKQRI